MNKQMNLIYRPSFKPKYDDNETRELSGLISFEAPIKYYQTSKGIVAKCVTLPKQMLNKIKSHSLLRVRKPTRSSMKLKPMMNMNKTEIYPFAMKEECEYQKANQSQSEIIFDLIKSRIANKLTRVRNIREQLEEQVNNYNKSPDDNVVVIRSRAHSKSLHAKKASKFVNLPSILP